MRLKKEIRILVCLVIILLFVILGVFLVTDFFQKEEDAPKELTEEEKLVQQGIKLVSSESFGEDVHSLLDKGYTVDEINHIYENMSDSNIIHILGSEYVDLSDFYSIHNFDFKKLERYIAYSKIENLDMKDIVTRVDLNLDEPFYQTVVTVDNPDDITVLVNKSHALPASYSPTDLVSIPSFSNLKLRKVAVDDFEKLLANAKLDNVYLVPYSTYRDYEYQDGLYQKYLKTDTQANVDTYSARPGHSEHQTGLAIDIRSSSHWYTLTDADYEWMKKNCYKYGFIIRYPKDNSTITGYKEEPWHLRYIGIEHATKVTELGITYDEYYDLYFKEY